MNERSFWALNYLQLAHNARAIGLYLVMWWPNLSRVDTITPKLTPTFSFTWFILCKILKIFNFTLVLPWVQMELSWPIRGWSETIVFVAICFPRKRTRKKKFVTNQKAFPPVSLSWIYLMDYENLRHHKGFSLTLVYWCIHSHGKFQMPPLISIL